MPTVFGYHVNEIINSQSDLRAHYKMPSRFVNNKVLTEIDPLAARFIDKTALVFVSTQRPDGQIDVSPRGDPPGFLKVLTPSLLALPDRLGNNRVDTFENIILNPQIGLICVIPGHRDTLRISGEARIVRDDDLAQSLSVSGKPAQAALLIKVSRVLCHCPKAFVRGGVWSSDSWPDTTDVPTLAEMMCAHGALSDNIADVEDIVQNDRQNRLY
ncbi:MSMEG_1061 family FMN-dependent PPOX-type flavoprotein [Roseovarius pelagicus]|uniref:Pyridoxamine 5'-phosphate oxidase family protein n=1 Tax=Roseovarius pelagicus TaxID=2980108 RepID=A0ABY6D7P5_9RHOB|nr:MSMEG_1061 family FMN-dependent PPOX-type flavoprotein [Roseovarius pelagicus]UXX82118.1 pyridoxamine 5'-phosphate oxidase family protein [Roseovarius pelagicus]